MKKSDYTRKGLSIMGIRKQGPMERNKSCKSQHKMGEYYTFPPPLFHVRQKLKILHSIAGLNIREVSGNYIYPLH